MTLAQGILVATISVVVAAIVSYIINQKQTETLRTHINSIKQWVEHKEG